MVKYRYLKCPHKNFDSLDSIQRITFDVKNPNDKLELGFCVMKILVVKFYSKDHI